MINYIRHDNEFYGILKLSSGDEVLGLMFAVEEDSQTVVYITDPLTPHMTSIEKNGEMGIAAGFMKWMIWSDEDFFIVQEADIVTCAPMSTEAIMMYKMWWRKEKGRLYKDDINSETECSVPINENMGLLGKVSEVRLKLEQLWQST